MADSRARGVACAWSSFRAEDEAWAWLLWKPERRDALDSNLV